MLFQLLMNPRAVRQDPRAPVGTPRGDAASPWPAESLRGYLSYPVITFGTRRRIR